MTKHNQNAWGPSFIRLGRNKIRVGRDAAADVCIDHPGVSRLHAELSFDASGIFVRDLKTPNGLRVNGSRVDESLLRTGDRLEFGPVTYSVEADGLRLVTLSGMRLDVSQLAIERSGKAFLEAVDFSIGPNEFVGILGPSGAGKSTLLKCLTSFLPAAAGKIQFDGLDLAANLDKFQSEAGYVPQKDQLHDLLTARENLTFAFRMRCKTEPQVTEIVAEVELVLSRLQLLEHADKKVAILSGGQRKRVNVAMELLCRPRILFLDEPTSGLDPAAETRLMRQLRKLANWGTTVVCATHVMENLRLLDRVVVVAQQTVLFCGRPDELLPHFQVSSYAELYEQLEGDKASSEARIAQPAKRAVMAKTAKAPTLGDLTPRLAFGKQVEILLERGARVIWKDRSLLLLLAGQPLLLGMLINLSQLRPTAMENIFLFAVVTSIWLGLNNTAREVVKDRDIYIRESMAGVTPAGYLTAKILLHGLIGLIQLAVLVLVIRYANFLSSHGRADLAQWPLWYVMPVLWVTYFSAMILGLTVSALATTEEVAVAWLPVIVLPQLLLTGVATGLGSEKSGKFESLVLLIKKAAETSRGFADWLLEGASLLIFSRPAICLLKTPDESGVGRGFVYFVDWLHLGFLLLIVTWALSICFPRAEIRWKQSF